MCTVWNGLSSELFDRGTQLQLPRPRALGLIGDIEVCIGDGIWVQLAVISLVVAADLTIDHNVCNVDSLHATHPFPRQKRKSCYWKRRARAYLWCELSSDRLCKPSQRKLPHCKRGRVGVSVPTHKEYQAHMKSDFETKVMKEDEEPLCIAVDSVYPSRPSRAFGYLTL